MAMIYRILRLVRAEVLKLRTHPFFTVSIVLLVAATPLGALFSVKPETVWRAHNAIEVFANASQVGLKMATFLVLVFGSLMFAGEFDRGTIKLLLTRPITRTDLFVAKSLVAALLALFFVTLVFTVALGAGCLAGELGPVWDDETYTSNTSYEELAGHAWKAVRMSVAAVVAAAFLGLAISTALESSGFAVAITLTLFVLVDEVGLRVLRDESSRRWFFNHYPSYAFDVLGQIARGSSASWREKYEAGAAYLTVPLGTMLALAAAGYAAFRAKNVTA